MKVLLRLLILLMVPVLIVTVPTTAQAAVRGPATTATFDFGASGPTLFRCTVTGQWDLDAGGASGILSLKGDCSVGFGHEYVATEIQSLMLSGEGGCTNLMGGIDNAEYAWTRTVSTASPCDITTLTVNICETQDWVGNDCWFSQHAFSVVLPESPAGGDCPLYSIGAPPRVNVTASPGQSIDNWYDVYAKFPFAWKEGVGAQTLRVALIYRQNGGPLQYGWPGGANGFRVATIANGEAVTGMSSVRSSSYGHHTTYTYVGVQIRSDQNVFGGTLGDDWGTTQPSQCFFYFGDKVTNLDGTDVDEPAGPIGLNETPGPVSEPEAPMPTEPSKDDKGCTFEWGDPTTWLEGGMCAAVGMLINIWETLKGIAGIIGGLAASIVDGLWDGLMQIVGAVTDLVTSISDMLIGLFVPSGAFLDDQVSLLQDSYEDTVVFTYLTAFTSQDFTLSATGCNGIPLNFTIQTVTVDTDLLRACDGTMAQVASIVKLVASAMLVIFGSIACMRGVGSGFGWAPAVKTDDKGK